MTNDLLDPPTAEEIEDLRALLVSDRMSTGAMTLSEMDGFMTGLVAGPQEFPPDEWVPQIFGEDLPAWRDSDEAGRYGAVIVRRFAQIARALVADPPLVEPWLDHDAEGRADAVNWANGFMLAIGQAPERWMRLTESQDLGSFLLPILALSDPAMDEDDEDQPVLDPGIEEAMEALREEIGDDVEDALIVSVIGIRDYWLHADARTKPAPGKKKRVTRERRR